jgi:hypothetical protein
VWCRSRGDVAESLSEVLQLSDPPLTDDVSAVEDTDWFSRSEETSVTRELAFLAYIAGEPIGA